MLVVISTGKAAFAPPMVYLVISYWTRDGQHRSGASLRIIWGGLRSHDYGAWASGLIHFTTICPLDRKAKHIDRRGWRERRTVGL